MFIKLDVHSFRAEFKAYGRGTQFSYQGLGLLFDYLEELESCEEPYELDVIGLCCDFAEDTAEQIAINYSIDLDGLLWNPDAVYARVRRYLEDEGVFVGETEDLTLVYRQH